LGPVESLGLIDGERMRPEVGAGRVIWLYASDGLLFPLDGNAQGVLLVRECETLLAFKRRKEA